MNGIMKRIVFAGLLIAMGSWLLNGCADDLVPVEQTSAVVQPAASGDSVTFTARLEQPSTKTVLVSTSVKWSSDDKIKVFNASNTSGCEFSLQSGAGTAAAVFSGAITGDGPFYAVYPASAAGTLSGSSVSVTLPAVQGYADGSFGLGANIAAGKADVLEDIVFKNLCGALSITMQGSATLSSFSIYTKGSESLCGAATISGFDGEAPTLTMDEGQTGDDFRCVSLNLGSGVALTEGGKEFIVILPVGALSQGFLFESADTDGCATLKNGKADLATIVRSTINQMPVFAYTPQYKSAFLQSTAPAAAFTNAMSEGSLSMVACYDEATCQYAYENTAGTPGSRMFRIQNWGEGYALGLTTPYAAPVLGSTVSVTVDAYGETGGITSASDVPMKVVKTAADRFWLVDPETANGFIMLLLED